MDWLRKVLRKFLQIEEFHWKGLILQNDGSVYVMHFHPFRHPPIHIKIPKMNIRFMNVNDPPDSPSYENAVQVGYDMRERVVVYRRLSDDPKHT